MSTIFFCSHKPEKYQSEPWRHVFSQWYDAEVPFIGKEGPEDVSNAIHIRDFKKYFLNQPFNTREEWMMLWKALIFAKGENRDHNIEVANKIKGNKSPKIIKELGRKVKGYDENVWNEWKSKIVMNGNYLQFSQNETMKKILLETGDRLICEASPYDAVWGIGLGEEKAKITDESKWGQNLLGKSIMQVRELIK